MIYTSNFGSIRSLTARGIQPISIVAFKPKYFNGVSLEFLAPSKNLLRQYQQGLIGDKYYTQEFKIWMHKLNSIQLLQDYLKEKENDVALLCYCKTHEFCHRHIVRELLNLNNITCKEFTPPSKPDKSKQQLNLF